MELASSIAGVQVTGNLLKKPVGFVNLNHPICLDQKQVTSILVEIFLVFHKLFLCLVSFQSNNLF